MAVGESAVATARPAERRTRCFAPAAAAASMTFSCCSPICGLCPVTRNTLAAPVSAFSSAARSVSSATAIFAPAPKTSRAFSGLRTTQSGSWPSSLSSFTTARPVLPVAPTTAIVIGFTRSAELVSPQPYQLSRRLEKARLARAGAQAQTAFAYRTKRGVDWLDARGKNPVARTQRYGNCVSRCSRRRPAPRRIAHKKIVRKRR